MLMTRCGWVPPSWRPALLVLAASRDWRWTSVAWGLSLPVVALMARARAELGMAILMYAPPLIALTVVARPFALVRRPVVWTALFTRATAGPTDLRRLAALCMAIALPATWGLVGAALAGLRAAAPLPATGLVSLGLFALAWSIICAVAAVGAASVARRGVAGLLIVWMIAPAAVAALTAPLGLPESASHAIKVLAPPLEAAVRLHDLLRGLVPSSVAPWFAAQLLGFPTVVAALFAWRSRRMAERPGAVE